jgi:excisionase family DNA binding protein
MNQEQLLSKEQVAKLLNVKMDWLNSVIFKKQIPFIKVGKHIRFCPKQITKWIEDRKIQEDSWN